MFVDKIAVRFEAGDGGNGIVSFRHEKFVEKGGPDGGDGGKGGDVVLVASRNQNTLAAFRYNKLLKADKGENGGKRKKHGKSANDHEFPVPVGTVVYTNKGELIADLAKDGEKAVVAKGGKGGFGNAHFTSSTRQAPRVAEKGEPGEKLDAVLELKLIADVGIVGLPNAGKSTLLKTTSNAKPEIADYPFTTLQPNLGVVDIDENTTLLMADIPGLIEGAAKGKGLGDEFLRHIERTSVLLHLIDIYSDDVVSAYKTIQSELGAYRVDLSGRPQVVALNKIDGLDKDIVGDALKLLKPVVPKNTPLLAISAASGGGVRDLLFLLKKLVNKTSASKKKKAVEIDLPVITLTSADEAWRVTKGKDGFAITGAKIEKFAIRTDFTNPEGIRRLRDIMRKMGIIHELERKGVRPGDKIIIATHTFEY